MQKISKRENGMVRVSTENTLPSKTQQQFKETTDINAIMRKYQRGEAITHLNHRKGQYGDFTQISDYQGALDTVLRAEKAFMALPSETRKKFRNNPQELIEFLGDKNNYNEAVALGLIEKKIEDIPNATINDANTKSPK